MEFSGRRDGMTLSDESRTADDPYNLHRFVHAQAANYAHALTEMKNGKKRTHWMWYIFPQLDGLAFSPTAKRYSIKSVEEARAYLEHPILGPRLLNCAEAVVAVDGRSATEIFGSPDDMKFRSCMTLFSRADGGDGIFQEALNKFFSGKPDELTLERIRG